MYLYIYIHIYISILRLIFRYIYISRAERWVERRALPLWCARWKMGGTQSASRAATSPTKVVVVVCVRSVVVVVVVVVGRSVVVSRRHSSSSSRKRESRAAGTRQVRVPYILCEFYSFLDRSFKISNFLLKKIKNKKIQIKKYFSLAKKMLRIYIYIYKFIYWYI